MALIKCSECGKEFSDKAKACPNCACPIEEIKNNKEDISHKINDVIETKQVTKDADIIDDDAVINDKSSFFNGISNNEKKRVIKIAKVVFLIFTIISFIIMCIILKVQIIATLLLSLLWGGSMALCAIAGLNIYYYYNHDKRKSNEKRKELSKGVIGAIVFMVIIGGLFFFILNGDGHGKNVPTDSELNACRNRSTTYVKCSWATLENRCVCKAR